MIVYESRGRYDINMPPLVYSQVATCLGGGGGHTHIYIHLYIHVYIYALYIYICACIHIAVCAISRYRRSMYRESGRAVVYAVYLWQ